MNVRYQVLRPNVDGGILVEYDKAVLKPLYNVADKMRQNFENYTSNNDALAGNIKRQYKLDDETLKGVDNLMTPIMHTHVKEYEYAEGIKYCDDNYPLKLDSAWIVFQKKHEFNPVHSHKGVFSFVIWLELPYKMEDELNQPAVVDSNTACAGHFAYLMTNSLGNIQHRLIPTDEKMEGCAFLFPSMLNHCVYPFYTSDEYRVSISGNYVISPK